MARKGRVVLWFECVDCQQKIRLSLYFGEKQIWNNSTSPTLQKLQAHETHNVQVTYQFELDR
jgi:hypothetical protein